MGEESVKILQPGNQPVEANGGGFGISLDDLKRTMELRKGEAITNLQNLGGIERLCQMLRTSPSDGAL